jgi:hypothetical protein
MQLHFSEHLMAEQILTTLVLHHLLLYKVECELDQMILELGFRRMLLCAVYRTDL